MARSTKGENNPERLWNMEPRRFTCWRPFEQPAGKRYRAKVAPRHRLKKDKSKNNLASREHQETECKEMDENKARGQSTDKPIKALGNQASAPKKQHPPCTALSLIVRGVDNFGLLLR